MFYNDDRMLFEGLKWTRASIRVSFVALGIIFAVAARPISQDIRRGKAYAILSLLLTFPRAIN